MLSHLQCRHPNIRKGLLTYFCAICGKAGFSSQEVLLTPKQVCDIESTTHVSDLAATPVIETDGGFDRVSDPLFGV